MSVSTDPKWLVDQLPSSLKWGHAKVKLSMKDAPPNVKAALVRLDRTDGKDPATMTQNAGMAILNNRDKDAELVIPKEPSGPVSAGTYRIEWVITYTNTDREKGSKVYHELETNETADLEKEALARLERDDREAQAAERKRRK